MAKRVQKSVTTPLHRLPTKNLLLTMVFNIGLSVMHEGQLSKHETTKPALTFLPGIHCRDKNKMKCSISPTEIPQSPALFNILPRVRTTCSLNSLSDTVKPLSADSCGEAEHLGKDQLQAQGSGMPVDKNSRQVIPLAPWGLIFKNIWKISKTTVKFQGH